MGGTHSVPVCNGREPLDVAAQQPREQLGLDLTELRELGGDVLDVGGLLGYAPILPVSTFSPSVFLNRGGRIPAPLQALKN